MKKLLLLSVLAFGWVGAQKLQVPQGTQFITGQVGYSFNEDKAANTENSTFRFLPTYGYYFAPDWTIAGSIGYKETTDKKFDNNHNLLSKTSSNAVVIIPSLRKFWVLDERLSLFAQLDVPLEFGNAKTHIMDASSSNSYFSYGVSLKPGVDYFLAKRWKIYATVGELGLSKTSSKDKTINRNSGNFALNMSAINFGLKFMIPKK